MTEPHGERFCLSRRAFLLSGGSAVTIIALGGLSETFGQGAALKAASYPRTIIGRISQLKVDQPVTFQYPWKDFNSTNMLVKLGAPAGGGVGPDQDIVAFSTLCTHMGGPLGGQYRGQYKVLGPCPFHLSTFDLTRHGMVVAGQATESLPQIVLE
ncbi:MAG: arsenate reductase (azurin) small subunit, partial [candidate division NC10 bacterium]|nr:arsenate reductase (azurin) small subunit [candidate division NC10 bacterium]